MQDDVLDGVFHLIDGILGTALAGAYHGVGLVKEEDGRELAALHRLAVAVEDGLDVLLAVAHPLALDLRHIHQHDVAPCVSCKLIDGLGLASAGSTVEQACEALPEAALFHAVHHLVILARH